MYNKLRLLLPVLALTLFSCSKEKSAEPDGGGNNPANKLLGTYDFVGAEIRTEVTESFTFDGDAFKAITRSHYFTRNNKGTYVFDAEKFTGTDIHYTIDTLMHAWLYINNVLDTHDEMPFTFSIGPVESSAAYKQIGADSIYSAGGLNQIPGGGSAPSPASGSKFSWSGDTLVLKSAYAATNSENENGTIITTQQSAMIVTKLKKRK